MTRNYLAFLKKFPVIIVFAALPPDTSVKAIGAWAGDTYGIA